MVGLGEPGRGVDGSCQGGVEKGRLAKRCEKSNGEAEGPEGGQHDRGGGGGGEAAAAGFKKRGPMRGSCR